MKKHIIGLVFFSFIISATVFIYKNVFAVRELPPAKHYLVKTVTGNGNRKITGDELRIRQAVFDLKTKQLNLELNAPNPDLQIALHFFIKDASGTQYINSAYAPRAGVDDGIFKATSSYEWLDRLGSYENLYIVPEAVMPTDYSASSLRSSAEIPPNAARREPKFDAEKAVSVLLYSGERGYLTEKYFSE